MTDAHMFADWPAVTIAEHEAAYHPGRPCPEDEQGRCAARFPRPVPSPEDRMRHATDTGDSFARPVGFASDIEQDERDALTTPTGRSFRTWMSDTDRDQLDARAAAAEQERDEALDDLRAARAEVALVSGNRDRIRKQLDDMTTTAASYLNERDEYREARDVAQQLAAFRQGVIDDLNAETMVLNDTIRSQAAELGTATDVLATIRDAAERIDRALAVYDTTPEEPEPADDEAAQVAVQNLLDDSTRAFAAADTSSERVEVIRDLLAGWYAAWPETAVTDPHEGIAWQLASMISAAEAKASAPSSVPPRRAQEDCPVCAGSGEEWVGADRDTMTGQPCPRCFPRRAQEEPASEEIRWAYRWIGTDGQVYDEMDASDNAIETGEQRAHRIAAKRLTGTVRGEVVRYRVLTMPAEVVATYPTEARP